MFADQISNAIARASLAGCDQLAKDLWRGFGAGVIPDDQAEALSGQLEARRRALRGDPATYTARKLERPSPSIFPPRRAQVSPDRWKSIERRRHLAASGPMPPALAAKFTQGELALLRIVADEVAEKGFCTRTLGELAARAGCCRSTVQNALRSAARAGLVAIQERRQSGRKNLPNVVRIISTEWTTWLARGERRIGFKKFAPPDIGSRNEGGADRRNAPAAMHGSHREGQIRSKSLIRERGGKDDTVTNMQ